MNDKDYTENEKLTTEANINETQTSVSKYIFLGQWSNSYIISSSRQFFLPHTPHKENKIEDMTGDRWKSCFGNIIG